MLNVGRNKNGAASGVSSSHHGEGWSDLLVASNSILRGDYRALAAAYALRTTIRQSESNLFVRGALEEFPELAKPGSYPLRRLPRFSNEPGPGLYLSGDGRIVFGRPFQCDELPPPFEGLSNERLPLAKVLEWVSAGLGPVQLRCDEVETLGKLENAVKALREKRANLASTGVTS